MSHNKKERVIHVDKLVVHAKEVEIIHERDHDGDYPRRDPWGFFWGRQRTEEVTSEEEVGEEN